MSYSKLLRQFTYRVVILFYTLMSFSTAAKYQVTSCSKSSPPVFQSHLALSRSVSFFPPSMSDAEMLLNCSNGCETCHERPHTGPCHQWNNKIAKTKGSEKDFPWHDDVRATASVAEFIVSFQRKLLQS